MNTPVFTTLVVLLEKLEDQHISYTLMHNRENTLTVLVAVPGERWEVEFLSDGAIEVEKFISTGEVHDAESLAELFARYADQDNQTASAKEEELLVAGKIA